MIEKVKAYWAKSYLHKVAICVLAAILFAGGYSAVNEGLSALEKLIG